MSLPPSRDPFYDPVPRPPTPGVPVRSRPVRVPTAVPSRSWQVVHGSTGVRGPISVSGTVLVPEAPWLGPGPRPLIGYGVGVHGLGRDAAPSRFLAEGVEPELPLVSEVLARGWAVAVTDGEGLGLPGPHTYGAGRPGGHAMLDLFRAARTLTPEVSPDSPLLLWGYSEGGRCAAWAAELQPAYAPELPLLAVAAGGVPADLYAMAKAIDGGPFSGLGLAVVVGLAHAYDDPALWSILSDDGLEAARRAASLDVVGLIVEHPQPLRAHTRREQPWDDRAWRAVLAAERNGARAPRVPTYLSHVATDEIVPVSVGQELARRYRAHGADVTWVEVVARDHLTGGSVGARDTLAWLGRVLDAGIGENGRTNPAGGVNVAGGGRWCRPTRELSPCSARSG